MNDIKRPKFHLTPRKNWMNDPNGFIYYRGEYHLYYQYFPYECKWGTMHWGHAISKDLANWNHQDIAIYPTKEFDKNGCFSGTAIVDEGKLKIYYTAIKYLEVNEENIHVPKGENPFEASQAMICSEDGYYFDNYNNKRKILGPIKDDNLGDKAHTRDPKVWKYKDEYIMVLGSKFKKEGEFVGEILFYKSSDGVNWRFENRYYDEKLGDMWECPDIFKVDDKWILVLSPENINRDNKNYTSNALYSIVDFNEETCEIKNLSKFRYIDLGLDLYAPQTTISSKGDRLLIGWLRMPKPFDGANWIGAMTIPRKLTVKEDKLYFNPVESFRDKFNKEISREEIKNHYKIKVKLKENFQINIDGYKIHLEEDCLVFNRETVFDVEGIGKIFKTPKLKGQYEIEIYVDNGIIETYINKGEYVVSNIIYERGKKLEIENYHDIRFFEIENIED